MLTVGPVEKLRFHWHQRVLEGVISYTVENQDRSFYVVDGRHIKLDQRGMFLGLPPGAVHCGFGEGSVRLMVVTRQHSLYDDPEGDMHFKEFPTEPSSENRFQIGRVRDSRLNIGGWPYTVDESLLTRVETSVDRYKYLVVRDDAMPRTIEVGGQRHTVGPGWLIAMKPGCPYRMVDGRIGAYSFTFQPDWQQLLSAMTYVG